MLVPIYLPMLGAIQAVGLANNMMSHLGYEFLPPWVLRIPLLRWMNTATFHSMHHTNLQGNYALMFRWLDRIFATEVPHYDKTFVARRGADLPTAAPSGEPNER